MGQVLQFQGDQRDNVLKFLLENGEQPHSGPGHPRTATPAVPGRRACCTVAPFAAPHPQPPTIFVCAELADKAKIKKHGHG
eukprot:scaffold28924_cov146-Isochrysis_galbana.AAC.5